MRVHSSRNSPMVVFWRPVCTPNVVMEGAYAQRHLTGRSSTATMRLMPSAPTNGIDVEYEEFGDPSKPTLLLVMGLGAQMIVWDERFCQLLADRGFHVIRYDNRDVGLSTKFDDAGAPDLAAAMSGDASSAAYLLADMADDGIGLLDALGVDKAHIVGASMGGMIVQEMAIRHPERVI